MLQRLSQGKTRAGETKTRIADEILEGFEKAMDDDLNIRLAFKKIFRALEKAGGLASRGKLAPGDSRAVYGAVMKINSVLRVFRISG